METILQFIGEIDKDPKLIIFPILLIAIVLFLTFYFVYKVKLKKEEEKTKLEKALTWDPPWAFSDETVKRLEAKSKWWMVITLPVRFVKFLPLRSWKLAGFFFILPFMIVFGIIYHLVTK